MLGAAALLVVLGQGEFPAAACRSPNGAVAVEVALRPDSGAAAVPHFRVTAGGADVVGWSRLSVDLADGPLGGPCDMAGAETRPVRDRFEQFPGKRREVVGVGNETVVQLRERTAPRRRWEVVLRAYDDGVALRYLFPAQEGWPALAVAGERTRFALPTGSHAVALPLGSFTTSHEKLYRRGPAAALPAGGLLGLPLLFHPPGGSWAALTEADVDEYAGLYVAPLPATDAAPGTLQGRLSPLPKEPAVAVRHPLPHRSPWRVVLVADRAEKLIESDLVLLLSEPRAAADWSWVKPGKTTFPWWNGFREDGLPFRPGLNTATAKHYIDFCQRAGIECHSLDGVDNIAWYGGTIVPHGGGDPTRGLPGLDLAEVLAHAKRQGVKLRLWLHWQAAEAHMERAFPLYRQWGVEGVMLDFMDRDDQEMNRFLRRAVALAAANRLTVTLHGVAKPTGLERTFPNLLTHEGVLNLEYNKWDRVGCPPEHQLDVPFTRMLAGPLDFHQGSFRAVPADRFRPRNEAPLVMGTPCRTLASYVVFQNHLSMVADTPTAYAGHPALPALAAIPTAWDDTKALAGSVGEFVALARRQRDVWHVGAMTDRRGRTLQLPLSFLGPGRYAVEHWRDDAKAPHGLSRGDGAATAADTLTVVMGGGGGGYVKLTPAR